MRFDTVWLPIGPVFKLNSGSMATGIDLSSDLLTLEKPFEAVRSQISRSVGGLDKFYKRCSSRLTLFLEML
jgi:hypothetical protein